MFFEKAINANAFFYKKNNIGNEIAKVYVSRKKGDKSHQVDEIAKNVCEMVGGDWRSSKLFYCKVAWRLSEGEIYLLAEEAVKKGKNPPALFNYLCRKKLLEK